MPLCNFRSKFPVSNVKSHCFVGPSEKIIGQGDGKSNCEGTHFVYCKMLLILLEKIIIWVLIGLEVLHIW